MEELTNDLRHLITENKFAAFFEHWQKNVPPNSTLGQRGDELKAIWRKLEDDELSHVLDFRDAGTRRAQLVRSLLQLVQKLTQGEEVEATATPDPLQDLMQRKLVALKRERILATDAAVKFKLDLEIEELKQQLG